MACKGERQRRNRLMQQNDPRVRQEPFLDAPYVYQNKETRYHAALLRAMEVGKRHTSGAQHILWVIAQDYPHDPKQVARTTKKMEEKRIEFLQFHYDKTKDIPGLLPLFMGMRAHVTDRIARGRDSQNREVTILKHTPCIIVGWDLQTADRRHETGSERILSYLPHVIYIQFEEAEWQIHSGLSKGVFPLRNVTRTWTLHDGTGASVYRKGFTLVPDYASTGFMIQGATLPAEIAECGHTFVMP
jgi:hypothetical protein